MKFPICIMTALFSVLATVTPPAAQTAGEPYVRERLFTVPWGSRDAELGIVTRADGSCVGPISFDVDGTGFVYILDPVNEAVKIFNPDGELNTSFSVPLPYNVAYLALDDYGDIWVNSAPDYTIHRFSANGRPRERYLYRSDFVRHMDPFISVLDGEIYLSMSKIVIAEELRESGGVRTFRAERFPLVGGRFVKASILGDGRVFRPVIDRDQPPKMQVIENGEVVSRIVFPGMDATFSAVHQKTDASGNIYIKLASSLKNIVQVWKYDPDLRLRARVSFMPIHDFPGYTPLSDVVIDDRGSIHTMIAGEDGLSVMRWSAAVQ